eukprot:5174237-Pleurochrysis_carterae.AAC.8
MLSQSAVKVFASGALVGGRGVGARCRRRWFRVDHVRVAAVSAEVHRSPVLDPPTCTAWVACEQVRLDSEVRDGARPGETNSVVYFCASAPRAHCGKVIVAEASVVRSATTSGKSQSGAWRLCRKSGE